MTEETTARRLTGLTVVALVACQVGLHGCLNGVRMAAPLQAIQQGYGATSLGLLMALFAVFPVMLALPAGRYADRHGYHRPVGVALLLSFAGAVLAATSDQFWVLCGAAALVGAGSSVGMIALQRTAGRLAGSASERLRIFSWIALAPAIANFVGPMLAGLLIDHVGFRAAFAALAVLPLWTWLASRQVPHQQMQAAPAAAAGAAKDTAWDLLRLADYRRVLFINWLITASWDAHSFALPILGHERGLSASSIGMVLGAYAIASASVRALIPFLAEHLSQRLMMSGALLTTAVMFATYPFMHSALAMAVCAATLGLCLGAIQPAMMATMHHVTPPHRHGEALGLRTMLVHLSTLVMPLTFGGLGSALGVGPVFWIMGVALASGGWQATRLPAAAPH
jgi:MFS family permease